MIINVQQHIYATDVFVALTPGVVTIRAIRYYYFTLMAIVFTVFEYVFLASYIINGE